MRDLRASLRDHPMAMLRVIADVNGVELTTNVREEASNQIAAALLAPEAAVIALAHCTAGARTAWQALLAAGGQMKVPAFTRSHGALRPVGPGKLEREMVWREASSPAEELWYRGLIFRAFADMGGGLAEYIYIPDELRSATPPGASPSGERFAEAPGLLPLAPDQAPATAQHASNTLLVDACALLAAVNESALRLTDGAWRSIDEARLRESFVLQDPVRFALLVQLARELGWLAEEGGRLAIRRDALGTWLRASPWEQLTAAFAGWRASVGWNDLRRLPSLRAEGEWQNDPLLARSAILRTLAGLDPGAWYAIADVVAWIKARDPDFQRADASYTGWYLRDVATGRYLSGFESWDEVEGRLIYFMITEPLFWLSAVELGIAAGSHAEAVRLSPAGAAWLAGRQPPAMPDPARLRVEEDFLVIAPLAVPLFDRYRLLRFTEPMAQPHQPGQPQAEPPATYHRISRRSLARARASGLTAEQLLGFLRRAGDGHLPERLEVGLARWEQHGGTVRIDKGALLRVEDASVLATLRADPVIGPLLGELISAQAVLVSVANLPRLVAALAQLGYSAKVEG